MYAACAETEIPFPFRSLVVSGGHTMLADISGMRTYRIVGRTRDDAAGEAFDKGAKLLGLGFPGGVAIEQAGQGGRADAYQFPRGMAHDETLDFSFSGLKTALLYFTQKHPGAPLADVAASYQEAVVDILVAKTLRAAEALGRKTIVVGGGVSASARLRALLTSAAGQHGIRVVFPSFALCTDNARMIAYRGSVLFAERGADDFSIDITPTFHPSAS